MANEYAQIAFTENVRKKQQELGSRDFYARFDEGEKSNNLLGDREIAFLAERDSFYLATVSETGWPYVQHRGGPKGFIRVLNEGTIAFSDFRGNRQYVTFGNGANDGRGLSPAGMSVRSGAPSVEMAGA